MGPLRKEKYSSHLYFCNHGCRKRLLPLESSRKASSLREYALVRSSCRSAVVMDWTLLTWFPISKSWRTCTDMLLVAGFWSIIALASLYNRLWACDSEQLLKSLNDKWETLVTFVVFGVEEEALPGWSLQLPCLLSGASSSMLEWLALGVCFVKNFLISHNNVIYNISENVACLKKHGILLKRQNRDWYSHVRTSNISKAAELHGTTSTTKWHCYLLVDRQPTVNVVKKRFFFEGRFFTLFFVFLSFFFVFLFCFFLFFFVFFICNWSF